ncbi:hypothetical protein PVAP13_9KG601800 [Panicum virgatum]|uniref:Secreted protein n=1 Tax=Panicum virgatum TaxID=38727 RepID=A0A8T0NY41_PANVG|nr:hypothetical protein PVAP13_9KG601800 [Panicum virgatum]
MVRAVVVAVLLMQCCNVVVVLAARPLLDGGGGRWYSGAGALIVQVLDKGGCSGPGSGNNSGWQGSHPGGGC